MSPYPSSLLKPSIDILGRFLKLCECVKVSALAYKSVLDNVLETPAKEAHKGGIIPVD